MSTTVVTPPAAAALVAVTNPSLKKKVIQLHQVYKQNDIYQCVLPGSLM